MDLPHPEVCGKAVACKQETLEVRESREELLGYGLYVVRHLEAPQEFIHRKIAPEQEYQQHGDQHQIQTPVFKDGLTYVLPIMLFHVVADDFHMRNCRLTSTQDTMFLGPLPADLIERYDGFLPDHLRRDMRCRQYFENCLIEGTVDFIFGCGEAQFRDCEIRSLYDVREVGYAAAPAHALEQTEGFTFRNCRFTAEPSVRDGSIYLARPWRDYGLCRFEDCTYGSHISPLGFDKWNDTDRDRTARFYETPAVSGRVKWVK